MDERVVQFRVGVVVIAAIAITVILVGLFGLGFRRQYTLYMKFPQAPGVAVDTPVRKNGVLVGRVSSVDLIDEGGVLLTVKIDADRRIRESETPMIGTASLFGDAVLEFVPSGESVSTVFEDGDLIETGVVRRSPLEALELAVELEEQIKATLASIQNAGDAVQEFSGTLSNLQIDQTTARLNQTMVRFESAADEVKLAAGTINRVVADNEQEIAGLVENTRLAVDDVRRTLSSVDTLVGHVDEVVADPELRAELKRALAAIPPVIDEAALTLRSARQTLAAFEQVATTADRNLQNLEGLTRPLGENGDALVTALRSAVQNLESTLTEVNRFTVALNSGEGAVGQLLYDEELATKIRMTVDNVEEVSRRLRPIMEDVRIFTDKIARDPRQLGLKGAVDQKPSGQGSKHGLPTEEMFEGKFFR